ncbi:MAG: hypothetical protein ACO1OB_17145 [Archangium sp.]
MPRSPHRVLALAAALCSLAVSATVIVHETFEQMTQHAPLIVRGRVLRNAAGWDDQKRRIWTWTELAVTERLKGAVSGTVLMKQPGGEVDGIGQAVEGTASFKEGEDVIVFLDRAPDEKGTFRVYGMSAGKIFITRIDGKPVAARDTSGLAFASPTGVIAPVGGLEVLGTVDEFMNDVRGFVKKGGAK